MKNTNSMESKGLFARAVDFARHAHAGQVRKGAAHEPYINHPLEVAEIIKTMTDDEAAWAAAVLHDTVEDTEAGISDIEREFGEKVAALVASNTENKRKDLPSAQTWKIRKQETIDHLNRTDNLAEKMLVLGDKLSNMRSVYNDFQRIGDAVWQQFNQKDKREHEWYYRGILEATRELSGFAAWQEYGDLLDKIFS